MGDPGAVLGRMDEAMLRAILSALGETAQSLHGLDRAALHRECLRRELDKLQLQPGQRTVHTFSDEQECDILDDRTERYAESIVKTRNLIQELRAQIDVKLQELTLPLA
eukprot:483881-Prymnesium_polylepis.1